MRRFLVIILVCFMLFGLSSCITINVNPGATGNSDETTLSPETTAVPDYTTSVPVLTSIPETTTAPVGDSCGIVITTSDGSEVKPKDVNGVATFTLDDGTFNVSGKNTAEVQLVCRGKAVALNLDGVEIHNKLVTPINFISLNGMLVARKDSVISYEHEYVSTEIAAPCVGASAACQLQVRGNAKLEISSTFGPAIKGEKEVIIIEAKNLILNSSVTDCINCVGSIMISDSKILFDAERYGFWAHDAEDVIKSNRDINITGSYIAGEFNAGGIAADCGVMIPDAYTIIDIKAKNTAISSVAVRANDMIEIMGGNFNLTADYGLLSTADGSINIDYATVESAGKVIISGGTFEITAADSGINCKNLAVNNGNITFFGKGDGINAETVEIYDGNMIINVGNHSIFADADVIVKGGEIKVQGSAGAAAPGNAKFTQVGGRVIIESNSAGGLFGTTIVIDGGIYVSYCNKNISPSGDGYSVTFKNMQFNKNHPYRILDMYNEKLIELCPEYIDTTCCVVALPDFQYNEVYDLTYRYEDGEAVVWKPLVEWMMNKNHIVMTPLSD